MLKRILVTIFIISGLSAWAGDNYLNSVIVENIEGKTSIVLRSDSVAKLKRNIESSDNLVLTLKDIKQSPDITTLYKNVSDVNGLIIQNSGYNDLKIYIEAPDVSKANIVFETPNSAPIKAADSTTESKFIWSLVSVALLFCVMLSAKKSAMQEPVQKDLNEVIKEREKALYKNFQREVATLPSINYKLKSYRKHVLKGETIRNYESRLSRI